MVGPKWAVSFDRNLCLWRGDGLFLHSGKVDWNPLGPLGAPKVIVGCGSSPIVTYDGTGQYVLELEGDQAELLILPDVRYAYPPWQTKGPKPLERVCELDAEAVHVFELRLEGWTDNVEISRRDGVPVAPLTTEGTGTRFHASPGQYRLTKSPPDKR